MAEHTLNGKVAVVAGGGKNLGGLISTKLAEAGAKVVVHHHSESSKDDACLLYTSPSPRDQRGSRMPSSA